MKKLTLAAGVVGVLCILAGFLGRFIGTPEIWVVGQSHSGTTFLLLGNTCLLGGIFLAVYSLMKDDPQKTAAPADAAKPGASS